MYLKIFFCSFLWKMILKAGDFYIYSKNLLRKTFCFVIFIKQWLKYFPYSTTYQFFKYINQSDLLNCFLFHRHHMQLSQVLWYQAKIKLCCDCPCKMNLTCNCDMSLFCKAVMPDVLFLQTVSVVSRPLYQTLGKITSLICATIPLAEIWGKWYIGMY